MEYLDRVTLGDCREMLPRLPSACVDLVMTSPPYGMQRKNTYGGVSPDEYVDWFLPIGAELMRVLKPTGSFVLNIKEHCENGERHTYVLELILALKRQGWLWTEEYIWHKPNPTPGKWPNRLKDGWERCLHLNKERRFAMYQDSVKVPSNESPDKLEKRRALGRERYLTSTGTGFSRSDVSGCPDMVLPSNVLSLAAEQKVGKHSAPYPLRLPDWFIRLFTQEGDTVLDPFMGSGTTAIAAIKRGRHYIGFDSSEESVNVARNRIGRIQSPLIAA